MKALKIPARLRWYMEKPLLSGLQVRTSPNFRIKPRIDN